MTTILVNKIKTEKTRQLVEFTNQLSVKLFESYFSNFGKKAEKVKESYLGFFNERNVIFIPKKIEKISFFNKVALSKPGNILEFPNQFEKFIELIQIKEATLAIADSYFSHLFKTGYFGLDYFYFLNSDPELTQYKEIIAAIDSARIRYYECLDMKLIFQKLKDVLSGSLQITKENKKEMETLKFWLKIGTSAIPYKK